LTKQIKVEDTAVALVHFKNGAMGVIEGSTSVYPGFPTRFEVGGEKGCIGMIDGGFTAWDIEGETEKPFLSAQQGKKQQATPKQ